MGITTNAVRRMLKELTIPIARADDLKLQTAHGRVTGFRVQAPQVGYDKFWYTHERQWISVASDGRDFGTSWPGLLANASPYTVGAAVVADLWDAAEDRLAVAPREQFSFFAMCVHSCEVFLTVSLQQSIAGPFAGEAVRYGRMLAAARMAAPAGTGAEQPLHQPAEPQPPITPRPWRRPVRRSLSGRLVRSRARIRSRYPSFLRRSRDTGHSSRDVVSAPGR